MEGGNTKEGVWGYFGLHEKGKWLTDECKAVPQICKKLKAAGYGTVIEKVRFVLTLRSIQENLLQILL